MLAFEIWIALLAGLVAGAVAVIASVLLRSGASRWTVGPGLVFCAGVLLIGLEDVIEGAWENPEFHLSGLATVIAMAGLWPFSLSVFGYALDLKRACLPGLIFALLFIFAHLISDQHDLLIIAMNAMVFLTGLAIIGAVARSGADDLDPARRRLRNPFMVLVGAWVAAAAALGVLGNLGALPPPLVLADEVGNALVTLSAAVIFTQPRGGLLPEPSSNPAGEALQRNAQDDRLLADLKHLMQKERVWAEEKLTVGALAERLGVAEHRLRPLINQRLGYRNFAAFVNEARLAEAKRMLRSPEHSGKTVAAIAYACGFASLGPFGRAFKADTGQTPSAYRRRPPSQD